MLYYSAMSKKVIFQFTITWMDLEGIIRYQVEKLDKDKYYMVSHVESKKLNS